MFTRSQICLRLALGLGVVLIPASELLAQCSGGRGGRGTPSTGSSTAYQSSIASNLPSPFEYQQAALQQRQLYALQGLLNQQQMQMVAMQRQLQQQYAEQQYARQQELLARRQERTEELQQRRAERVAALKAKRAVDSLEADGLTASVRLASTRASSGTEVNAEAINPFDRAN